MRRMIRRLLSAILAVTLLVSVVSVCYAVDKPKDQSIDVWAKKTTKDNPNVYSVEVSLFSSGSVQAGGFDFEFSSMQILTSTELIVHQITSETDGYSWFKTSMDGLGVSVSPFEIYRVENGEKIELSHDIQVKVSLPGTYRQPKLYLLDTYGNTEAISMDKSGSAYTFEINQNGYYVFVDSSSIRGDITLDGYVTNADVVTLARYLVNLEVLDEEQLLQADYDGNRAVNNADLIKIARSIISA